MPMLAYDVATNILEEHMRRAKQEHRLLPFTAGVISGYITTLAAAAAGAGICC